MLQWDFPGREILGPLNYVSLLGRCPHFRERMLHSYLHELFGAWSSDYEVSLIEEYDSILASTK